MPADDLAYAGVFRLAVTLGVLASSPIPSERPRNQICKSPLPPFQMGDGTLTNLPAKDNREKRPRVFHHRNFPDPFAAAICWRCRCLAVPLFGRDICPSSLLSAKVTKSKESAWWRFTHGVMLPAVFRLRSGHAVILHSSLPRILPPR